MANDTLHYRTLSELSGMLRLVLILILWLHPSAKMSAEELRDFVRGLEATFGRGEDKEEREDEDEDKDKDE